MIINNALVNGKNVNIVVNNGVISKITTSPVGFGLDIKGKRLIPGLIDVHTHGLLGMDTMDGEFEKMCMQHIKNGTTSWLPTTMTTDIKSLKHVCTARTDFPGAEILGFHFEGPYISREYKGAQNEKYIKNPNIEEFSKFSRVAMVTVAPELPGAMEFIKTFSKDTVISLGHTACTYDTALAAIQNGAKCLTHTYNAMPAFDKRKPGPIGAAFEKNIYVQLICDGFHVSRPVVLATYKMFGPQRVVLISDSIAPSGLPNGEYVSGEMSVIVKDKTIRLKDGTIAGSYACLWDCVKKCVAFGIPFEESVRMASETPAQLLGVRKGKICPGYDADLLVISHDLEIEVVIKGGKIVETL